MTVDACADLEPLPAAVEVAAYHIVSEALTNVVRRDGALHLTVRDDGLGLPDGYRPGTGLHSMRERAGELGGAADAACGEAGGTEIRARIPLPQS